MSQLVLLDDEQAAILEDIGNLSVSLLGHRVKRADPAGTLSASIQLQQLKMRQLLLQLTLPPIPAWEDMPKHHRETVLRMAEIMTKTKNAEERGTAFSKIWAAIMASRTEAVSATLKIEGAQVSASDAPAPQDEGEGA